MVWHGITSQGCNIFQLFCPSKMTGNHCTPVTSIIVMSFIRIELHHLMKTFKVAKFMSQSSNSIDLPIIYRTLILPSSYLQKPEWGIGERNEGSDGKAGNQGGNG